MARHNYYRVVKRLDTPGPDYHIVEALPGQPSRTVAKSADRIKANMSAGIRDSEKVKELGPRQ